MSRTLHRIKRKAPRGAWPRPRWNAYVKYADKLLDKIFIAAEAQSIGNPELAARAGLAPTTVHNIDHRNTATPRQDTIWKLATAMNMLPELVELHRQTSHRHVIKLTPKRIKRTKARLKRQRA